MKEYYQKSMRTLQLAGMKKPTQKHDTRAVPMLVAFYNKTPGKINEQKLQDDFLHRKMSTNGLPQPCLFVTAASNSILSASYSPSNRPNRARPRANIVKLADDHPNRLRIFPLISKNIATGLLEQQIESKP